MSNIPHFLSEFEERFGDEDACAEYLATVRWPNGFVCPACGSSKAWRLETKPWTYECAGCGRQTSVTAGTIMHHSKLPLTTWLWAAYVMATQPNGISALQLHRELGLGSYKTAWLLCAKLRRNMAAPGRNLLSGLVEVGETEIPCRSPPDTMTDGDGKGHQGTILVVGAVEVRELGPGGIRLSAILDRSTESWHAFIAANLAPGAAVRTKGWPGYYGGGPSIDHDPRLNQGKATRVALPWVHRIFANLKVWALGTYHGLRRKHLQSYLDEFVFRFDHRRTRYMAFPSLLGIAAMHPPLTYDMLVSRQGKA
jgi:transposase-like protein